LVVSVSLEEMFLGKIALFYYVTLDNHSKSEWAVLLGRKAPELIV
jgi:hypothetical protein